jgi:molybdate transport system substrate-binding protein
VARRRLGTRRRLGGARSNARRVRGAHLAGWLLVFAAASAGGPARAQTAPTLRVLAAASLTEVVGALGRDYARARIVPSFGGSSELARQIADGAPADVFLSASPEWTEFVAEAGALDGAPVVFARNALVCVAPNGSALAARRPADPRALLAAFAAGDRAAIADEGVPAGEYARAALGRLGLLDAYRARLVGQKDVRAVLHTVERGELEAGFVYATDARVAAVATLFAFDPATHPPIVYHAAALRGAASPDEARRCVAWLREPAARGVLAGAGFAPP